MRRRLSMRLARLSRLRWLRRLLGPLVYIPRWLPRLLGRGSNLTALMKQLMEAGFCVTRPLFLSAAWCYRERGERYPRVVITGIDRLWRAPNNDAPQRKT